MSKHTLRAVPKPVEAENFPPQLAIWLAAFGENDGNVIGHKKFVQQYGEVGTWNHLIWHIRTWKRLSRDGLCSSHGGTS